MAVSQLPTIRWGIIGEQFEKTTCLKTNFLLEDS
jgi:hypothetical protein